MTLKEARIARLMTQAQAAKEIGVDRMTLARWEWAEDNNSKGTKPQSKLVRDAIEDFKAKATKKVAAN